ncbi:MAG TPA: hypothetical protein VKD90_09710 [Gemmataceae bacterium]|nr:hypothetical protein [Gemmataceae bacterium]
MMDSRPEDLEKRLAAAEQVLRSLQDTLVRTQQLIDEARQMLADANRHDALPPDPGRSRS